MCKSALGQLSNNLSQMHRFLHTMYLCFRDHQTTGKSELPRKFLPPRPQDSCLRMHIRPLPKNCTCFLWKLDVRRILTSWGRKSRLMGSTIPLHRRGCPVGLAAAHNG